MVVGSKALSSEHEGRSTGTCYSHVSNEGHHERQPPLARRGSQRRDKSATATTTLQVFCSPTIQCFNMARVVPGSHTYIDLKSLLASQHPAPDLRINEFEELRDKFLKGIVDYSNRAIEEITRRRSVHVQELKKIAEKKQSAETETTACKVNEIKLMEGMYLCILVTIWCSH